MSLESQTKRTGAVINLAISHKLNLSIVFEWKRN